MSRLTVLYNGRKIGTVPTSARSVLEKLARARGDRVANRASNVAGFLDSSGTFHPIRKSVDYSARRAGETGRKRRQFGRPEIRGRRRNARRPRKLKFGSPAWRKKYMRKRR